MRKIVLTCHARGSIENTCQPDVRGCEEEGAPRYGVRNHAQDRCRRCCVGGDKVSDEESAKQAAASRHSHVSIREECCTAREDEALGA